LLKERRPFGEEVVVTTQHTTPLWRRVRSLPHTPLGQWAIGLTVGSALLLIFGRLLSGDRGIEVSPWSWMILIAGILAGAVFGLIALLRSPQHETERSSAVEEAQSRQREDKLGKAIGVGLGVLLALPLIVLPSVFLAQILRHIVTHNASIASTLLFLVAMMAVVAASHFLQRGTEGYGSGGTISSAASLVGFALILGGTLIGYVSQEWLLATNLMGGGLVVSTIGLAALAIFTLMAGVVPWWGGAALLVANPFLVIIFLLITYPPGNFTTGGFLTLWLVPVPMLVAGFAELLAARRRYE
jgi:MFS family permease